MRLSDLVRTVRGALRERGPARLLSDAVAYGYREILRPRLPGRPVAYAGMPTAVEVKPGDRWLPARWVPGDVRDIPDYEATLVEHLREHVRPGDRVVVVGGGVGVTAVVAARQAGAAGTVQVFEGSAAGVRAVRQTARLNAVADRIAVEHAVVARAVHVYGRHPGRSVDPSALPACDVLELDCEGSEIEILSTLAVRPRAILVETHGIYGAPTDRVLGLVGALGYDAREVGVAEPRIAEICREGDIRVVVGVRR